MCEQRFRMCWLPWYVILAVLVTRDTEIYMFDSLYRAIYILCDTIYKLQLVSVLQ